MPESKAKNKKRPPTKQSEPKPSMMGKALAGTSVVIAALACWFALTGSFTSNDLLPSDPCNTFLVFATDSSKDDMHFFATLNHHAPLLTTLYGARGEDGLNRELTSDDVWSAVSHHYGQQDNGVPCTSTGVCKSCSDTLSRRLAHSINSMYNLQQAARGGGDDSLNELKVLVAGGGPIGLRAAIEARLLGHSVKVLEKRERYTRDIWFDLHPQPWYPTIDVLDAMGFRAHEFGQKTWEEETVGEIVTVRAQTLERYLAKTAAMLGVRVQGERKVVAICEPKTDGGDGESSLFHLWTSPNRSDGDRRYLCQLDTDRDSSVHGQFERHGYDVLVVAEGAKSTTRDLLGMDTELIERVDLGGHEVQVDGLRQAYAVLNFKPDAKGNCPRARIDPLTSHDIDPWAIGFTLSEEVHSVFKRFYFGYCQLQILWSRDVGEFVTNIYNKLAETHPHDEEVRTRGLPWSVFLDVTREVFEDPPQNAEELQAMLADAKEGNPSVVLDNVIMRRVGQPVRLQTNEKAGTSALNVVLGDAAATAHFRLGVGINSAFGLMPQWRELLRTTAKSQRVKSGGGLRPPQEIAEQIRSVGNDVSAYTSAFSTFQLRTMFAEAYCDLVVFFDPQTDVLSSQVVSKRIYSDGERPVQDYEEIESMEAFEEACGIQREDVQ